VANAKLEGHQRSALDERLRPVGHVPGRTIRDQNKRQRDRALPAGCATLNLSVPDRTRLGDRCASVETIANRRNLQCLGSPDVNFLQPSRTRGHVRL